MGRCITRIDVAPLSLRVSLRRSQGVADTLYAPPNHRDGVVHHTREDAEADNEHLDGTTTE
jgi:hypothetical protein